MEKLIVSNFLNLKHIELDLAKITIIIGPQAQGKSILAKLVFFFKDLISEYIKKSQFIEIEQDIIEVAIKNFSEIFPYYSWVNQSFKIHYIWEIFTIKITYDYGNKPILDLSANFQEIIKFKFVKSPIFIPSNRSFFANLQKNVFLFLSEDLAIDYFLKRFGLFYQKVKTSLENKSPWSRNPWEDNDEASDKIFDKILIGRYQYENGEDWIYFKDGTRINLMNASSGQQEALPIILILSPSRAKNRFYFIEEPEAHLFPSSQKYIVKLISIIFYLSEKDNHFFITTHSPYILTAFNNLIQAGNTLKAIEQRKDQELNRKKLFEIVPKNEILDINDFGVYTLKDGGIKSIINTENKLIDTNIIDEVSNQMSEEFQQLLDLEFEEA